MSDYTILEADAFGAVKDLPPNHGDCAIVDYPWTVNNECRPGRASYTNPDDWQMQANDALGVVLEHVEEALSSGSYVFVFADDDVLPRFRRAVDSVLEYRKTLIWDTQRIGNGHYFRSRHAYVIVATVDETDRYVTDRPTVLEAPAPQREPGETTEYPTEKPVSLYRQLLEQPVLRDGDTLLEPFCGSAPGGAVASQRGIDYWGCDVSSGAVALARKRDRQQTVTDWGETA